MLRVLVRTDDATMFVNTNGGAVETTWRTFDLEAPELEAFLRAKLGTYCQRQVIAAELLEEPRT